MKSHRFEIKYNGNDGNIHKLMINIPIGEIDGKNDSFTSSARDWVREKKGIDCIFASYRGYGYTTEDITAARNKKPREKTCATIILEQNNIVN